MERQDQTSTMLPFSQSAHKQHRLDPVGSIEAVIPASSTRLHHFRKGRASDQAQHAQSAALRSILKLECLYSDRIATCREGLQVEHCLRSLVPNSIDVHECMYTGRRQGRQSYLTALSRCRWAQKLELSSPSAEASCRVCSVWLFSDGAGRLAQ